MLLLNTLNQHPVNDIQWIHYSWLRPNSWNPNRMFETEWLLLKLNILKDGWCDPIKVFKVDANYYEIIDGYHRWKMVAEEPEIAELTEPAGLVPIAVLDLPTQERMCATVRFNRASGEHGILPMKDIVANLHDRGMTLPEIMGNLGMTAEEVIRLTGKLGMPDKVKKKKFSKAWKPSFDS